MKKRYLNGIVGTNIVLIDSFQPANIIVSVRNQMNIKLPWNNSLWCIVNHILGFHYPQPTNHQNQEPNFKLHFHNCWECPLNVLKHKARVFINSLKFVDKSRKRIKPKGPTRLIKLRVVFRIQDLWSPEEAIF